MVRFYYVSVIETTPGFFDNEIYISYSLVSLLKFMETQWKWMSGPSKLLHFGISGVWDESGEGVKGEGE